MFIDTNLRHAFISGTGFNYTEDIKNSYSIVLQVNLEILGHKLIDLPEMHQFNKLLEKVKEECV